MKQTDLWPPLDHIRREIECNAPRLDLDAGSACENYSSVLPETVTSAEEKSSFSALQDICDRRNALKRASFSQLWAPGVLVGIALRGKMHGVLLDKQLADNLWQGWLAAPECDWAGPYDVLLEPEDEPFDPSCGMVQTWNLLQVSHKLQSTVLGMLSHTRLGSIRAVHQQAILDQIPEITPQPGRIGLRAVDDHHYVLTGTPLDSEDPRLAYQELYRKVAIEMS